MGIFTKLSTVIKSNINDLISKAENPEKMLNQIILDMRDQLAKAKREVAAAIADERKLKALNVPYSVKGSASDRPTHGDEQHRQHEGQAIDGSQQAVGQSGTAG